MDLINSESVLYADLQNSDQKDIQSEGFEEVAKDSVALEVNQSQDSSHYWWCPYFQHQMYCSYPNTVFEEPGQWSPESQWSPVMANPYLPQMSSIQKNLNSEQSHRKVVKKSAKNYRKDYEIEKLYSCRLCDDLNQVKDLRTVRKHIEDHLGKVRPFVCQICGKVFAFRSNCRNHIIAHSVVRKHIPIPETGLESNSNQNY